MDHSNTSLITSFGHMNQDATNVIFRKPFRPTAGAFPAGLLPIVLILLALGSCPAYSAEAGENASKLEQLSQQIRLLRTELDTDQQRKQDLQSQLRDAEIRIGKLTALLKALNDELRLQNRELDRLKGQQRTLQSDLQGHRVSLVQQVRAAYAIGQQEYLKILLNQQDPSAVTRTLTYYDYFHRARLQRIHSIDTKLSALREVEQAIQTNKEKLQQNRQAQTAEKDRLEQTRNGRSKVLAQLDQQIRSKGERLSTMLADQERLQRLLRELAESPPPEVIPPDQDNSQPFAQLRGKLPWPTRGSLAAKFGNSRQEGNMKWQGVLIESPEGTDVRAISHGRIAYSDWLRGFGLLTIIDHGDGYMSLYGGNQSLYKEVGDWVDGGEVIASVGNSGGRQETALYFEIRHNGKPTNPLKWCQNTPKRVAKG